MDEFDKLIASGKMDREGAEQARRQKNESEAAQAKQDASRVAGQKQRLLQLSMGTAQTLLDNSVLLALALFPVAGAVIGFLMGPELLVNLFGWKQHEFMLSYFIQIPGLFLLGLGIMYGLYRMQKATICARERQLLRNLPFDFNQNEYEDQLSNIMDGASIALEARFEEEPEPAAKQTITDAIYGSAHDPELIEEACLEGSTLRVQTRKLATSSRGGNPYHPEHHGNSTVTADNSDLHIFVSKMLRKGLAVVHTRYPIQAATVRLEHGKVYRDIKYPWW